MSRDGRIRAAIRIADYFAGGPHEMHLVEQAVVLQSLETLRIAAAEIELEVRSSTV